MGTQQPIGSNAGDLLNRFVISPIGRFANQRNYAWRDNRIHRTRPNLAIANNLDRYSSGFDNVDKCVGVELLVIDPILHDVARQNGSVDRNVMSVAVVDNVEASRAQIEIGNEPGGKRRCSIGAIGVPFDASGSCFGSQISFGASDFDVIDIPTLESIAKVGRSGRASNPLSAQHLDTSVRICINDTVLGLVFHCIGLGCIGNINSLEFHITAAHGIRIIGIVSLARGNKLPMIERIARSSGKASIRKTLYRRFLTPIKRAVRNGFSAAMIAGGVRNRMGSLRYNVIPNIVVVLNDIGIEVFDLRPLAITHNQNRIALIPVNFGS